MSLNINSAPAVSTSLLIAKITSSLFASEIVIFFCIVGSEYVPPFTTTVSPFFAASIAEASVVYTLSLIFATPLSIAVAVAEFATSTTFPYLMLLFFRRADESELQRQYL